MNKKDFPLQNIVFTIFFIIAFGYLLKIAQNLLMPLLIALISVYILLSASNFLGKLKIFAKTSDSFRRILVLFGFFIIVTLFISISIVTSEQLIQKAPFYQENLQNLLTKFSKNIGIDSQADWQSLRDATIGKINLQALLTNTLGSIWDLLASAVMVAIYSAFLLSERNTFKYKLSVAFQKNNSLKIEKTINKVGNKLGNYLAAKTLINLILCFLSWVVLRIFGIDFALFWAIIIGLLNYIPYLGSFLGVIFPVLLSLAQFASINITIFLMILLSAVQFYVGNFLEPKIIGKEVNLSPVIVIISLSLWYSLWGIAGAILAIPLTSIIVVICALFENTKSIAILFSENIEEFIE